MSDIELGMSENVRTVMQERGIKEEDVREVLEYASECGVFLKTKNGESMLAKKRIGSFTVYVKYSGNNPYEIVDTYSHRVMLEEDQTK